MAEARKLVLVAEDDESVRELLVTRLELAGYATATARDGVEALDVIGSLRPHAVILDIGLPGLDGFGVLKCLREDRSLRDIPVLVLTARNSSRDVGVAIGLGAKDYMSKPFDDQRLLTRVARLVRMSRHHDIHGAGKATTWL
jgi:DNA-binding response OmpR family regulator